ncbi:response regulator transcription factor [Eggerthellaceae bacterium 3-80]|nr:DNA-binding response regulator [bacterium D16-34]
MESLGHIAVCDDDQAIANLVSQLISENGWEVSTFYLAKDLLEASKHQSFDLVLLDIMMPGIDGFECCRQLRKRSDVPIVFLSAKDEEVDKVVGFELGADDYIVKPFKPRELIARVKARLRRKAIPEVDSSNQPLEVLGIVLDRRAHTITLFDQPVSLTPIEFDILASLMEESGKPVASNMLYEQVWKEPANAQSNNTVMVHIRHIRQKLAAIDSSQEYIETVWGVGYKLG